MFHGCRKASLPLARHTYNSRERGFLRFYGYRKTSLLFAKAFLIRVCTVPDVFTVAGTRLCHSQKQQQADGAVPFRKRSTRIGKTNWYDLWGIQCNTVLQNSPPQARKFLGFSTAIS